MGLCELDTTKECTKNTTSHRQCINCVLDWIIEDIDKKAQHFLDLQNNQRVNGLEDALNIIEKHRVKGVIKCQEKAI